MNTENEKVEKELYKILDEICGTSEWMVTKATRKGYVKRITDILTHPPITNEDNLK